MLSPYLSIVLSLVSRSFFPRDKFVFSLLVYLWLYTSHLIFFLHIANYYEHQFHYIRLPLGDYAASEIKQYFRKAIHAIGMSLFVSLYLPSLPQTPPPPPRPPLSLTHTTHYTLHTTHYTEDNLKNGGNVLVHCVAGISRSASVVLAYLMWKENMSFEEALEYLKGLRPIVEPNDGFVKQLKDFEVQIRNGHWDDEPPQHHEDEERTPEA